jgi:serine/threonine-protein kinase
LAILGAGQDMQQQKDRSGVILDGRYRLDWVLGRGSHGVIYRATELATGALLAVKVLGREVSEDPQFAVRLWREAQALKALDSAHVVKMHRFGHDETGAVYLAMELLHGETLEERLAGLEGFGDRMNAYDAMAIFDPVATTLKRAHEKGILHRDLKPANIFLVEPEAGGGVRLMDFGLAKTVRGSKERGDESTGASLTMAGMIAGSPNYIAPEVWRTEQVDARIDVYSLGAVIFRALAGRPPFDAPTTFELFVRATGAPRPKITPLRPDLDPAMDDWVARALAIDRDHRYEDVSSMWSDFVRILMMGGTPSVRRVWDVYARRR